RSRQSSPPPRWTSTISGASGWKIPGQRRQRPVVPVSFGIEAVLLAKCLQRRQVRHRLDSQVPAELPQADRTQVQRPCVPLLLVVAAVHQAAEGGAVGDGQDVAKLVGRRGEGPPQAQAEGGFA